MEDKREIRLMRANMFQIAAHGACGQVRKFSGDPYHVHPQAVAHILQVHVSDATTEMIEAAYLHDVVEDTKVTYETINFYFGSTVENYVRGLTNVEMCELTTNRAKRKEAAVRRLAAECREVKIIKLCDRLHNLPSVLEHCQSFAKVYVPETRVLLDTALHGVHDVLWNKLDAVVRNA